MQLMRNVQQHWNDVLRSHPVVRDPQEYFLKKFPNLPVVVHGIVRRSSDWKERPSLEKYFR